MKCCIVKDLLPGYIDGLTSEETNEEMKMHLENCNSCNTIYRQMTEELPIEIPPEKTEIDFLKKLKTSMHRKYVIVALSTCVILFGTTVFLKRYEIPVSYAPDCMTICPEPVGGTAKGTEDQSFHLQWPDHPAKRKDGKSGLLLLYEDTVEQPARRQLYRQYRPRRRGI